MCEENVNELLKWVYSIEHKIATVGGPREKIDELRNQINALKVNQLESNPLNASFSQFDLISIFYSKSRMKLNLNNDQLQRALNRFVRLF